MTVITIFHTQIEGRITIVGEEPTPRPRGVSLDNDPTEEFLVHREEFKRQSEVKVYAVAGLVPSPHEKLGGGRGGEELLEPFLSGSSVCFGSLLIAPYPFVNSE